ncbi:MAG: hypothetical protein JNM76_12315 [Betaproteobacteria bacterium]|nr:hypothetical protein [Betaproteobacteria bacterium]
MIANGDMQAMRCWRKFRFNVLEWHDRCAEEVIRLDLISMNGERGNVALALLPNMAGDDFGDLARAEYDD